MRLRDLLAAFFYLYIACQSVVELACDNLNRYAVAVASAQFYTADADVVDNLHYALVAVLGGLYGDKDNLVPVGVLCFPLLVGFRALGVFLVALSYEVRNVAEQVFILATVERCKVRCLAVCQRVPEEESV